MRLHYSAIFAISLALSSFAAPLLGGTTEEEGLSLRWDDYDIDVRGLKWHDVPSDKRYHQTGKLEPHPGETDPHITYRTGKNDQVTNYQGWQHNEHAGKMTDAGRWRGEGKEHGGIKPPIYYPPKGEGKAHAAGHEHDPNKSRSPSPHHKRALTWHDVPSDKRYHQESGKLAAHPGETEPYITYRKGSDGKVTNYQGWQHNEHAGKMVDAGRWRGTGKKHADISPPIYYPPNGAHAYAAGHEHDPNRSRLPSPTRT